MGVKKCCVLITVVVLLICMTNPLCLKRAKASSDDELDTGVWYEITPGDDYFSELYFNLKYPSDIEIQIEDVVTKKNEYYDEDDEYNDEEEYESGELTISFDEDSYLDDEKNSVVFEADGMGEILSSDSKKIKKVSPGRHCLYCEFDQIETMSIRIVVENEYTDDSATIIWIPSKKTITIHHSYRIKPSVPNEYEKAKGLKWSSSNNRIASVNSKGVVKAKKLGECTIYCKLNNGKKYKCKVFVKPNIRTHSPSFTERYADCDIDYKKLYYNGKNLVMNSQVYNIRIFKALKYDWIKITVYDGNGGVIAKNKFKNISLNVPPYSKKNITLVFPAKSVKKKKYDLRADKDIYISYTYYYTYEY